MINLNNYVAYNDIHTYLLEKLCNHISFELKFRNGKGLDPRFSFYNSMYESLGRFDNAGKVTKHILNELKNSFESQIINCIEDKVFFNKIDIKLNTKHNGNATYLKYDDGTIYIELYVSTIEYLSEYIEEYELLVIHELLHAYEDFNRIKNGKDSIFNLLNNEYQNAFNNLNNIDDIKMYFARCKYFLNPQERNAYLSKLESTIKQILKSKNYKLEKFNYKEFEDDLKNTDIWKIYFQLFVFIEKIKTYNDKKIQEYIEKTYSVNYEKKTYKEICKELTYKWHKFNSKFNQLVPKILCNNLQIKENREYSFFIDKLNKDFEL